MSGSVEAAAPRRITIKDLGPPFIRGMSRQEYDLPKLHGDEFIFAA